MKLKEKSKSNPVKEETAALALKPEDEDDSEPMN